MPRVAPDTYDQIVWYLNEISGPYRNSGSYLPNDSDTDLNINNSIIRNGTGLFGDTCAQIPGTSNFPTGSSSTRNYAAGAKDYTPSAPFTLSFWINLKSYTPYNNRMLVAKEYRDSSINSSWINPFLAVCVLSLSSNGGTDWGALVAINSSNYALFQITDHPIPLGEWSHIGMTYDGSYLRVYLNGCQMFYYTGYYSGNTYLDKLSVPSISYTDNVNGYGYWKIGAITATGSGNKEEPSSNIQDIRIANVARPLSYFKEIYEKGVFTLKSGSLSTQYYKLRAYDLSCVNPTPVVWIDTEISLANAPAFPCSGPYSDPEVLDTWYM